MALVIAIPAVVLAVRPSCGCASPSDLAVINFARDDASVSWQGPGLFGTPIFGISGAESAPACKISTYTLRPGAVDVTISTTGHALSVRLDVAEGAGRGAHAAIIVIRSDGLIAEPVHQPPAGGYPEGALCS